MADKSDAAEGAAEGGKSKGGKKKLIVMLLPTLLLVGGAGWFFFGRGGGDATPTTPASHAGPVVSLDPITINLAGGHYLKLGLALQTDASAGDVDGSRALDLAISEFSGLTVDDLSSTEGRDKAKEQLVASIRKAYLPEGTKPLLVQPKKTKADPTPKPTAIYAVAPSVYDVYFTEFVMQ